MPYPHGEGSPPHPATEASQPRAPSQPRPADEPGWAQTSTAAGGQWPGGSTVAPEQAGSWNSRTPRLGSPQGSDRSAELLRYGPGVPGTTPGSQAGLTAEEVWRTGQLPGPPPQRRGRLRRRAGTALTVVLLIAVGVVIYLRLHHAPLTVTGVAITSQVKNGCGVNVTGRISTSGGAGTVSYQWVFTPQSAAPTPLRQSVTAGQSTVYVTIADQGQGHGQAAQQVTLQVLGPGKGSASTHVVISC